MKVFRNILATPICLPSKSISLNNFSDYLKGHEKLIIAIAGVVFTTVAVASKVQAVTLATPFSSLYSLTDLGAISKLPIAYGGLTFKAEDPSTLLIGGSSDFPDAGFYSVSVTRDTENHITSFGNASLFAKSPGINGGGIDAGLTYSPDRDVLLYTTYPDNSIGQIKTGSSSPDKQTDLGTIGISDSTGSLGFVPEGLTGAGQLKISSYSTNKFYSTNVNRDSGTYGIAVPSKSVSLSGGLDGFVYVKAGNPGFSDDSLLMSEYDNNAIAAYKIDANGDPIPDSRRDFITGIGYHSPTSLIGVQGATVDPVTGDFLFSTYFEGDPSVSKVYEVRRSEQLTSVPEPQGVGAFVTALALIGFRVVSNTKKSGNTSGL